MENDEHLKPAFFFLVKQKQAYHTYKSNVDLIVRLFTNYHPLEP